ncbi:ABC transporter substrate-binding protein [Halobacteriales archaeon Cl-PHB]
MLSRRRFLTATGATGVAVLAGCQTETTGEGTPTPDESEPTATDTGSGGDSESVRIGFLHSLSGSYSVLGEPQKQAAELAVRQLNENGGIDGKQVEAFHQDTSGESQTAREKAQLLVENQNVDILSGMANSAAGLAVQEYANEQDVLLGSGVGADPVTKARCNRVTFRYELRTGQIARAVAPWAIENLGSKVWFHVADYAYGNAFLKGWKSVIDEQNLDVDVVNETKSSLSENDYSSYITSIQSSDADFVAVGMAGGPLVQFNKQASSYNLRNSVDMVAGTNDFLSVRQGGGSNAVGSYSGVRYFEGMDTDLNREFVSGFIDEFDAIPNNHAESQWTMVTQILAPAIEEAGSVATDDVVSTLEGMEFDSPMGGGTIRECDHQADRPVNVAQISQPQDLDILQGKGSSVPSLDIQREFAAGEAIAPCDQTGCSL